MKRSATEHQKRNEHFRAHRSRLSSTQIAIEEEGMRLRAELDVSDYEYLPLEIAVTCIPSCEVLSLRHVPSIPFETLIYFRTDGYHIGAFARPDERGLKIVFNDAHPPNAVRVNVMEELFHLRLGHKPDILSVVSRNGRHRTYDVGKEDEALGCAIATLVPFAGLHAMLSRQMHIRRIAEHFAVPVEVVERRIGSTNLGDLMNAQLHQFALMPEDLPSPMALSMVDTRITGR